jgi:ubiquinone/menaquinone biosynthesis C-methylase UbiE
MNPDKGSGFLGFGENEARRVEAIYQTPDVVAQRERVLDALALRPGERVADLGCGPGLLALQMAERVGPDGEIQCIDASESMMALARRRCAALSGVHLRVGDVATLPYADHSFDAAVCTQVYEYVPDIDRALGELYRVLKPGGRVVVVDTDWESCVWHSSDQGRMRRMIEAWDRHCPHPQLPRTLAAQLRSVGFENLRVDTITLINDRYHPDTYSFGVIPQLAAYASKHGLVPREEADAWVADLQELGKRGEYFFSLNRYLFFARRSAT